MDYSNIRSLVSSELEKSQIVPIAPSYQWCTGIVIPGLA